MSTKKTTRKRKSMAASQKEPIQVMTSVNVHGNDRSRILAIMNVEAISQKTMEYHKREPFPEGSAWYPRMKM
jgi:hypothetical protein